MANFQTHLSVSVLLAGGVAGYGLQCGALSPVAAGAVFVTGAVAGVLPDLDHDTGKPLEFLFQALSVLLPALVLVRLSRRVNVTPEFMISYFAFSYLFLYWVVMGAVKKITRHRGILHSIPFALLCAGWAFLLFLPSGQTLAGYIASAVGAGCLSHLVLDELSSLTLEHGFIPRLKSSAGTALKLASPSNEATMACWLLLFATAGAIYLATGGGFPRP